MSKKSDLEAAAERLGVRFPPRFVEKYLSGVEVPEGIPASKWMPVAALVFNPKGEVPEGVGFPSEGDPDFYCLLADEDGELSEVLHHWNFESRDFEAVEPYLGAKASGASWKPSDLAAQSPMGAKKAEPVAPPKTLLEVLLERELIEIRPVDQPSMAALLLELEETSSSAREFAERLVASIEDDVRVREFFFDEDELVELMKKLGFVAKGA
jgi:hypothetical protein